MTILEKLTKVSAEQAALEQKQKLIEDEKNSIEKELVSVYGENWKERYDEEVAKLEAFDDYCSA